jgi:hypothetical protein
LVGELNAAATVLVATPSTVAAARLLLYSEVSAAVVQIRVADEARCSR